MEKKIAQIRNRMITVITLIAILATWQHTFIIDGISAHVEMNMTIIGTFAFSIILAFIFVHKLKNEIIAFNALKEMWDDIQSGPREEAKDPLWRHYRCAQPAKIFRRPRLLGHAYELVTEELARTKKIRVSIETMNTLVHTIEQTISDEKSLIVYLSGLLVFMGLIGTFIGLLHMVGAIGGIIGSLANSAGGAGATGAFQELLAALQEPLKGMAAGFASSLFGLFSSLVVGLLGRFAGQAAGVLKGEFEAWLAGVVQFGEDENNHGNRANEAVKSDAAAVAAIPVTPDNAVLLRMIGNVLADYSRISGTFGHVSDVLKDMRASQDAHAGTTERLVGEMNRLHATQTRILEELSTTTLIAPALRDLGSNLNTFGETVGRRIEVDVSSLREMLTEMNRSHASNMRLLSSAQLQTSTQMAGAIEQLSSDIDRRSAAPSSAMLEATLERSVSNGIAEVGRFMAKHTERLESRANTLAHAQAQILSELARVANDRPASAETDRSGQRIETALSDGFGRLDQTMETAFAAYSSLLHVALAAMERADKGASLMETGKDAAPAPEQDAEQLEQMLDELRKRAAAGRA